MKEIIKNILILMILYLLENISYFSFRFCLVLLYFGLKSHFNVLKNLFKFFVRNIYDTVVKTIYSFISFDICLQLFP